MERLKPTNDYIFKKIFGSNKNALLLKDLLQSILTDIKISKVVIDKDVSLDGLQILMYLMKDRFMKEQDLKEIMKI